MSKRWLPHLLSGATWDVWLKLLWQNGVSPRHWLRAMGISSIVGLGTPVRFYERLRHSRKIRQSEFASPPVFLIGHWQSGHSVVHYLLQQDPQNACVSLRHCVLPSTCLTTRGIVNKVLSKRLPKDRQVDTLPTKMHTPQGDDMALANFTDFSFYHTYCFPKQAEHIFRKAILFEGVSAKAVQKWGDRYLYWAKKVATEFPGQQMIFRNASNTGRIPEILQTFPDAKFIHIHRNPYQIYSALAQRWEGLLSLWALQPYDINEMQEHTLTFFELMMTRFFETAAEIPEKNLANVKFETLESDPLSTMEAVYQQLELPGFDAAREPMQRYLDSQPGTISGHELPDAETCDKITRRWGFAIDRWNYARL